MRLREGGYAGGVELLEREDAERALLQCCDSFGRSACGCERGDGGNAREYGCAPNRLFVEERLLSAGRIDDELDAVAFDEVDDVGPAFQIGRASCRERG